MAINTVIATNLLALNGMRNLGLQNQKTKKASDKLSSSKKLNSAADDSASLAISKKIKAQVTSLEMAEKNVEDTVSLMSTAEAALTEVSNIISRIKELSVEASNDTNQTEDREKIAYEVAQLLTEIDEISIRTEFNGKKLYDGSTKTLFFQIGSNEGEKLEFDFDSNTVTSMRFEKLLDVFGISKEYKYATNKKDNIVIEGPKKSEMVSEEFFKHGIIGWNKIKSFDITFRVRIDNEQKELKFRVPVEKYNFNGKTDRSELGKAIEKYFNENKEFSQHFEFDFDEKKGTFKVKAKEDGGRVQFGWIPRSAADFKIVWNAPDPKAERTIGTTNENKVVTGQLVKIDLGGMKEGDSLYICGLEFKKTASQTDDKFSFSNLDELVKKLKENSIVASVSGKDTIRIDGFLEELEFPSKYNKDKEVSRFGEEYSFALDEIDNALEYVNDKRSTLGATINRLEKTKNNLNIYGENLSSALSVLEDTDVSKEMINLVSHNVKRQAATSILAQSNQSPSKVLDLLK